MMVRNGMWDEYRPTANNVNRLTKSGKLFILYLAGDTVFGHGIPILQIPFLDTFTLSTV